MRVRRGDKTAHESRGPDVRLSCVFEDDGECGYLYALHYDGSAQPIKDAVQIYGQDPSANDREHALEFRWTASEMQCGLFVDGVLEGFVDFEHKLVCARSDFPPVSLWSGASRLAWRDSFANYFD